MRAWDRLIAITLICLATAAIPDQANAQSTATDPNAQGMAAQAPELASFVADTLRAMALPDGTVLPGLSDAKDVALSDIRVIAKEATAAKLSAAGTQFDIVRYTPAGKTTPLLHRKRTG